MSDLSQNTPKLRQVHRQRPLATSRAIGALMLREMSTTYGRSPLGYLWAVLQPVGGTVMLALVFSMVLYAPPIGKSFLVFYATGMIPFMFYNEVVGRMALSIQFSRQLLTYPSVTLVDALAARFILNTMTQVLVVFILFGVLFMVVESHAVLNISAIALGLAMTAALAGGLGVLNAFLFGIFPEWARVWSILNRPMFLLSCVLFMYETIPDPFRSWLWYNPLVHIVGQIRIGFYPYYDGSHVSVTYVFLFSLICLVFGLLFLRRYAPYILNEM